jgi:6,7-dimethyl-8-ribityllumazine synthase
MPTILEPAGSLPPSTRVAIAVSRYNDSVTSRLLDAAVATGRYAAVLCLGAIIRGETSHDRHIAQAAAAGIEACGRSRGIPVLFGVLTCETLAQAVARAGGGHGNKGHECAEAAIAMIRLTAVISAPS